MNIFRKSLFFSSMLFFSLLSIKGGDFSFEEISFEEQPKTKKSVKKSSPITDIATKYLFKNDYALNDWKKTCNFSPSKPQNNLLNGQDEKHSWSFKDNIFSFPAQLKPKKIAWSTKNNTSFTFPIKENFAPATTSPDDALKKGFIYQYKDNASETFCFQFPHAITTIKKCLISCKDPAEIFKKTLQITLKRDSTDIDTFKWIYTPLEKTERSSEIRYKVIENRAFWKFYEQKAHEKKLEPIFETMFSIEKKNNSLLKKIITLCSAKKGTQTKTWTPSEKEKIVKLKTGSIHVPCVKKTKGRPLTITPQSPEITILFQKMNAKKLRPSCTHPEKIKVAKDVF